MFQPGVTIDTASLARGQASKADANAGDRTRARGSHRLGAMFGKTAPREQGL
jgi:hypothetical protein